MNILLVHGSFHDERCWQSLAPLLVQRGFKVHTLTLPGHGTNRRNPYLISMSTYAQYVCQKVGSIGSPCIALGHSMGGFVISAAAEMKPEIFDSLIYLTAYIPGIRKSSLMNIQRKFPCKNVHAAITPSINGFGYIDKEKAKDVFYGKCSEEVQREAVTFLCPQPLRPTMSRIDWSADRLGTVAKHFIECTEDNAIFIEHQRGMVDLMKFDKLISLPSDHSPFFSMPEQLADGIAGMYS
ncbi:MAG TPA: alpha/beta hydrolase [Pseudomonadales bacterium]|nr:alpha/beta hydrolase [Pseudomonadales bacterium]